MKISPVVPLAALRPLESHSHLFVGGRIHHNKLVPTVGGVLLFGDNPEAEFPDAWIQCGRFGGAGKRVIADSLECHGVLTRIVDEALEFIKKHTLHSATISGLKRKESTNIPLRAARELLVNAVVHADYSQQGAPIRVAIYDDRLEIDNPGVLLSGLTLSDIKHGNSKLRNRVPTRRILNGAATRLPMG